MRKRPSIASEYLVSVSHQCIASVPTFETSNPSFFTPHPSVFGEPETAPSAPSGINVVRNVARNVARDVARDVVRNVVRGVSRNVSRDVSRDVGRMRQYDHLTGAGSPPFFTSVITCP